MAGVAERDLELTDGGLEIAVQIVVLGKGRVGCGAPARSLVRQGEQPVYRRIGIASALETSKQGGGFVGSARLHELPPVPVDESPVVRKPLERSGEQLERPVALPQRRVALRFGRPVRRPIGKIPTEPFENDTRLLMPAGAHQGERKAIAVRFGRLPAGRRNLRLKMLDQGSRAW